MLTCRLGTLGAATAQEEARAVGARVGEAAVHSREGGQHAHHGKLRLAQRLFEAGNIRVKDLREEDETNLLASWYHH
jgi:hypothetical protein